MMNPLWTSLYLTLVGMGIVFIAILLLWAMMALLVRLTGRQAVQDARKAALERAGAAERERKRRAAAAAIAVALNRELDYEPHEFPIPPTAVVSAWQSVSRASLLHKRGPVR